MTLDPKSREGFDRPDSKFLEIVDKFGWHVMGVAPRVGDDGINFSYSTGLFFHFQHPEILLFGINTDAALRIINYIGQQVRGGTVFEANKEYEGIYDGGVKCQFRKVHAAHYNEYVGWSQWFYEGSDFPILQCFWPDERGLFPWEKGFDHEVAGLQPQLFRLPSDVM
jgi:hypothetical protein